MDTNEEVPALWNKYFLTFLLAINQRQLLIHLIAQIMESNIMVPILSKDDLKTDNKQEKLHCLIDKLPQAIYTDKREHDVRLCIGLEM